MSTPDERLRRRIANSGAVPFADFMEEALYGEEGYYRRDDLPIGKEGDFVTGSALSPLFARATARLIGRLDRLVGNRVDYLEVGYGNAAHLRHLTGALGGDKARRMLAWDRVGRALPDGVKRLDELDLSGVGGIDGMIFSYELFDALPVHRLIGLDDGSIGELWVDLVDDRFRYRQMGLSSPEVEEMLVEGGVDLLPGQIADLSPAWRPLYSRLASSLERGLLVTCDYGFERQRLLDPRIRSEGTLACFRGQRVHRDALRDVGRQDLTAHVDFTALRQEGEEIGLETVALTRQATWLVACGIFTDLGEAPTEERIDARTLLDPGGMGEEIRVLVQSKGVVPDSLFEVALTGPNPSIQ